jgi:hypothetical protein
MALLRAKWFAMGVPVGFWWGWKKSNVWEMEKVVESVLPPSMAKHVVDLLPKGTADTRQKVRLQESIRENGRKQEETIRKLEMAIRKQVENAARQEETIRKQEETIGSIEENNQLLRALLARLPEADGHRLAQAQESPPTTATPPPPKQ